jgi:hypothetical protein
MPGSAAVYSADTRYYCQSGRKFIIKRNGMRRMKRFSFMIIACALLTAVASGCREDGEKINVIKGPGAANNSIMAGFNELCDGSSEGFASDDSTLITSEKLDGGYRFYAVNLRSGEKRQVFSGTVKDGYCFQMSPGGGSFLCNNHLVEIGTGRAEYLPEADGLTGKQPDGYPSLPSYAFLDDREVILVSPFYYIRKYYMHASGSFGVAEAVNSGRVALAETGEKLVRPELNMFRDITAPDLDYIKEPVLLLDELKYIFIGCKGAAGETLLYAFDFFTGKFNLIDKDVKSYSVSSDRKKVAYIKSEPAGRQRDILCVSALDGTDKRELADFSEISGAKWSPGGNWIAYSAGNEDGCDIGIIKPDGGSGEQLTHGMYSSGSPFWSPSESMLAFTSSGAGNHFGAPKVYIIKLNHTAGAQNPEPEAQPDPSREKKKQQLLDILRRETSSVMKQTGS